MKMNESKGRREVYMDNRWMFTVLGVVFWEWHCHHIVELHKPNGLVVIQSRQSYPRKQKVDQIWWSITMQTKWQQRCSFIFNFIYFGCSQYWKKCEKQYGYYSLKTVVREFQWCKQATDKVNYHANMLVHCHIIISLWSCTSKFIWGI